MSRFRSGEGRSSSDRAPVGNTQDEEQDKISLFTKQIARSVTRGQKVTLYVSTSRQITGYIAAHDDDSILMLIPDVEGFVRKLVKRAHVTDYDLHDASTFQDEPSRVEMEQILSKYRSAMFRVLGRDTPPGGNR